MLIILIKMEKCDCWICRMAAITPPRREATLMILVPIGRCEFDHRNDVSRAPFFSLVFFLRILWVLKNDRKRNSDLEIPKIPKGKRIELELDSSCVVIRLNLNLFVSLSLCRRMVILKHAKLEGSWSIISKRKWKRYEGIDSFDFRGTRNASGEIFPSRENRSKQSTLERCESTTTWS